MADDKQKIKEALLKRATGYDYEEKEIVADKSGKPGKVKVITKHMPPELSAIKIIQDKMKNGEW